MRYFCQLLVFGIFLVPFASAGQGRFPISVDHSGEDQVGQRYAFELKEAIRGSQGMNLVQADVMPQIRVVVVTIDDSMQNKGYASAIATTILYDSTEVPLGGAHLTTLVQTCGRDVVNTCARSLLAAIDAQVTRLRTRSPRLWNTLFER